MMTIIRVSTSKIILTAMMILIFIVLTMLGLNYVSPTLALYLGSVFALVYVGLLFFEIRSMRRVYLMFTESTMMLRTTQGYFVFDYEQVQAIDLLQRSWEYILFVAYENDEYYLRLPYLNAHEVWLGILQEFKPEKIGQLAYVEWLEQQVARKQGEEESSTEFESVVFPLQAKPSNFTRAVGWFVFLPFIGMAIWTVFQGLGWGYPLFFCLFACLGLLLILPDKLEMDDHAVTRTILPFGRFQIRWDEIEYIEVSTDLSQFILCGRTKRLPINGPSYWVGPGAQVMWHWFGTKLKEKRMPWQKSVWASLVVFPKNSRI